MIFGPKEDGHLRCPVQDERWGRAGDLNPESVPPKLRAYQPPC
jgi:hypothetical protein